MQFFLKELTEKFDESIVDLFHNFPKEEFGIVNVESDMNTDLLKNHIKKQLKTNFFIKKYVFYCENAPIGFATFVSSNFDKNFNSDVISITFSIRESYRGVGLGNLILNKMISKGFELNYQVLKCEIRNDNEIAKKVLHINNFKKSDEKQQGDKEIYYLKLKV